MANWFTYDQGLNMLLSGYDLIITCTVQRDVCIVSDNDKSLINSRAMEIF